MSLHSHCERPAMLCPAASVKACAEHSCAMRAGSDVRSWFARGDSGCYVVYTKAQK